MARMVPKQVLEDIRFRCDISDVIGSYISLQKAGVNFKALCPFHKEKTPSFTVNTQRQIFHCFGCGEGGDVFKFVMQQEGVDFITAVRMLAEKAGVELELEDQADSGVDKRALYRIHEEISRFYQRCLNEMPSAQPARDYLASRDLAGQAAENFLIGFAPNRWDAALQWAGRHKISHDLMESAGLVIKSDKASSRNPYYDRFRNRLMFPIHDSQGRVIGFSGRALEEDARAAKYVNSPETPLFRKSRVLYALDKARRAILDTREAMLCEGQIDVIRCHQAGLDTAIAAQGTAFTEEHARALKHYADSVILVFDPDDAGKNAAVKTARILLEAELDVRVANLPGKHDPDTFIREFGAERMRDALADARSIVAFQFEMLSAREADSGHAGRNRVAREVLATIKQAATEVRKAQLLQEAAAIMDVPVEALQKDLAALQRKSRTPAYREAEDAAPPPAETHEAPPPSAEIMLCEHLAQIGNDRELCEEVTRYLPLNLITHSACRRLAAACFDAVGSGRSPVQYLESGSGDDEYLQRLSASVLSAPAKVQGKEFSLRDALHDLILDLWRRHLKRERNLLDAQARTGEAARDLPQQRHQLTHDIQSLRTWEEGVFTLEILVSTLEADATDG